MEPFQFPAQEGSDTPAAVDYSGTLRIIPIVDGDRSFIEWYVEYDCPPKDAERWRGVLMDLIPRWVNSLGRALDNR